jgi:signal transduction histidine kinase
MSPTTPKALASLYVSLILTTVLAATLVIVTIWLGTRARNEDEWVRHTLLVRNQLGQVLAQIQRAETSQRGYLLTGDNKFLAAYDGAVAGLPPVLDEMAGLVADNLRQVQAVNKLRGLIADKIREMASTIALRKTGSSDGALEIVKTDAGRQIMIDIRQVLSSMDAEENRLLDIRQASASNLGIWLALGAGGAFLLICCIGAMATYVIRRSFLALATARDQLIYTNQELLDQVSRREQVESQFRQAQKMEAIGQLTGGIAHDFNNMLGVISGSLELMRRRVQKGDFGIERFMDAAQKATERAAALTHRLLAFARQQPLEPEPLDANRMIADMSDLLRSTLGDHFRIETVSAAGLWTTNADSNQLESAILNIAINARDAMPQGGKLTIETANAFLDDAYSKHHAEVTAGQYVMIAVSDTGTGMKPDVAARAFDPFFTTKPAGKGTGLGLSQVYGFVKQSQGHIKIYSEIGDGTTIKIYLPRLVGAAETLAAGRQGPVQTGQAGEVILVVEDDPLMRKLSTEALLELGYTVLHSESAATALTILDGRPDIKLLFTDVVMPETNGKKLADEALRRRPDLKVLFTTGYTQNAVVHGGALDAGVNLLTKPFAIDQLATKVRAVLDA